MGKQTYDSVPPVPLEKASDSVTPDRSMKRVLGIGLGLAVGTMLVVAGLTSTTARVQLGLDTIAAEDHDSGASAVPRLGTGSSPVT